MADDNPLLNARIDMSLDDIIGDGGAGRNHGGGRSPRGRGRHFARTGPKPYERGFSAPPKSQGPPPPVSFYYGHTPV